MQPQHRASRRLLTVPLVDTSRALPLLHPNGRLLSSHQVPQSRTRRLRNLSRENRVPIHLVSNRANTFSQREGGFAATLFGRPNHSSHSSTHPPRRSFNTWRRTGGLVDQISQSGSGTGTGNKASFSSTSATMVKPDAQVIEEFKEYVNMTPDELEAWLKTQNSIGAGIKHEGASESVGHESGGHILDIMKRNPTGKEGNYTDGKWDS